MTAQRADIARLFGDGARAAARPVVQRGATFNLAGVSDAAELRAHGFKLEDEIRFAASIPTLDAALINLVFEHLTRTQLETKVPNKAPDGFWKPLITARQQLGATDFDAWFLRVGLAVTDIPNLRMTLSDKDSTAFEKAQTLAARATPLPQFAGRSYEDIVQALAGQGYVRQERFHDVSDEMAEPYGQDVWTSEEHLVVRIKVGGRSINGRFRRPPHVVKEVSKVPHAFGVSDILAKMTDNNVLIPAGTLYSARDMQTWYSQKSGNQLPADAYQHPEASGNQGFIDLFHRWTEGAHTAIGAVPAVSMTGVPAKLQPYVPRFQKTQAAVADFRALLTTAERVAASRGENPAINKMLKDLNVSHHAAALARVDGAQDKLYQTNPQDYVAKQHLVYEALLRWKKALTDLLATEPPVKKRKPYFQRLFLDLATMVNDHAPDGWAALKSPHKK
ncbi:hypothetical protein [Roseateles sp. L2-2]|uniref:hypothetical protein n=1 Tax=Roseateles sp. L2-2 TaxID=3422597 RepID=UPI003D362C6F